MDKILVELLENVIAGIDGKLFAKDSGLEKNESTQKIRQPQI